MSPISVQLNEIFHKKLGKRVFAYRITGVKESFGGIKTRKRTLLARKRTNRKRQQRERSKEYWVIWECKSSYLADSHYWLDDLIFENLIRNC